MPYVLNVLALCEIPWVWQADPSVLSLRLGGAESAELGAEFVLG